MHRAQCRLNGFRSLFIVVDAVDAVDDVLFAERFDSVALCARCFIAAVSTQLYCSNC